MKNVLPLTLAVLLVAAIAWLARPTPRVAVAQQRVPATAPTSLSFAKSTLGDSNREPRVANVHVVDFDHDGLNDILICDVARNAVILYRQTPTHQFEEHILAEGLNVPVHATVVDFNGQGRPDVVVSILGNIFPSDEMVGKVILLENQGGWRFSPQVILDDVRRVADVQAGDFNGDGRLDLAVAVFGYARGEILWLENRGRQNGRWHFRDHQLLDKPGTIHVPVGDLNGDGRPDIAAVVSQDEEEIWAFENLGGGNFKSHRLAFAHNFDVGSAGLVMADLNGDGRPDLLWPQGDNLEDRYSWPQPYHGCVWLENRGDWNFIPHQIAKFGGTYAAAVGDFNGDGFPDVVLVSYLSDGHSASVILLENDGHQNFTPRALDDIPIGLVTVAAGDLNGDGRADIVAGGLHLPPFTTRHYAPATVWLGRKK